MRPVAPGISIGEPELIEDGWVVPIRERWWVRPRAWLISRLAILAVRLRLCSAEAAYNWAVRCVVGGDPDADR